MKDDDATIISMIKAGCCSYLLKDIHPEELKFAIHSVMRSGFYYSHTTSDKLANLFRKQQDNTILLEKALLNDSEIQFLKLVSSDLTYKEIAQKINLSPRAVDNMRDNLFEKLSVKSRVGLAMYAIKHGVVNF